MKKYYKIYPQFNEFCKLISNINLEDDSDYLDNDRNDIYDRLRLPIRMFKGDKRKSIDNLIKDYFNIDNWGFNQTINISELELLLANVDGVNSVPELKLVNKYGNGYSQYAYNIEAATKGKIIYPSLDPSVFELKYPDADIRGRAK